MLATAPDRPRELPAHDDAVFGLDVSKDVQEEAGEEARASPPSGSPGEQPSARRPASSTPTSSGVEPRVCVGLDAGYDGRFAAGETLIGVVDIEAGC